ncbi:hypothetical protein COCCADRAFT_103235 [Bipolaris zeicola 26-R-13]|uniref:Uncharacterized protein n=1 Tax=Cochliobolus carbonum (strain 26-R-13) TaxID=930089 RepID=W6YHA7_COCC2|nr:uncharacterized protein COCCADRAFT_103235 [Bipolaris zeicola 26-R-13]EUC30691.1 hypothetical protein COCCADRAFT_103235 [Bipolaris zeicola 26-R-13]
MTCRIRHVTSIIFQDLAVAEWGMMRGIWGWSSGYEMGLGWDPSTPFSNKVAHHYTGEGRQRRSTIC